MRLREALHDILFGFESDLGWYHKRASAKKRNDTSAVLHHINSIRVAMLSPFAPHITEEMWAKLGNVQLVSRSAWPEISTEKLDHTSIQSEELLQADYK